MVYDCMISRDSMSRRENKDDLREVIKVSKEMDSVFYTLLVFIFISHGTLLMLSIVGMHCQNNCWWICKDELVCWRQNERSS